MIVGIISSNVYPPSRTLTLSPTILTAPGLNTVYYQQFSVTGGYAPYTWSIVGTIPSGITFNPSNATLSGTTSESATFTFTVTVIDVAGYTTSREYTFTVGRVNSFDYVVIGGGGGGGGAIESAFGYQTAGGGGGAGGYLTGSLSTATVNTFDILVGAGGDGGYQLSTISSPTNGGDSGILSNNSYLVRAIGGGWGSPGVSLNSYNNGGSGASGGGAATAMTTIRGIGGTGSSDQNGYAGGRGAQLTSARTDVGAGGGGGAGGPGQDGVQFGSASGGAGVFDSIAGYVCAGGSGGYDYNYASGDAKTTKGSGGSGGRYSSQLTKRARGQAGAPGVVIIAYPLGNLAATASGNYTYSEVDNKRVYTFTGPGTISFT